MYVPPSSVTSSGVESQLSQAAPGTTKAAMTSGLVPDVKYTGADSTQKRKRGTWVAHLVKHLTSTQVMISQFVGSSPASGSLLSAWNPLQILYSPLSLPLLHTCTSSLTLSLSLSKPCLSKFSISVSSSKGNKSKTKKLGLL